MNRHGSKRNPEKEAHWRSVIKDWKASKLSGTAFCRQANIKVTTFYSWLKVVAERDKELKSKSASETAFVPVAIAFSGANRTLIPVEIEYDQSFDLRRINCSISPDYAAIKPTTEFTRSPVENKLERVEIWLKSGSVIRAATTSPRALVELLDRLGESRC